MTAKVVVVGGGNMGAALARGLVSSGWDPGSLAVAEPDSARRASLIELLPGVQIHESPVAADGAVVAVKPGDAEPACRAVAAAHISRVLSVMAGVRIASLESWVGATVVVRAMPNTPALLGAGAAAISGGTRAEEADLSWAEEILGSVGTTVRVPEASLDAVTGLSGSGPAYLFYVAEALIEAGSALGLPEEVSRSLVLQTFRGSALMLAEAGEAPEVLRARVTSPGGTTEAGIGVLAEAGVAPAFERAVTAAARRSAELGG
ncbi:MAG: pyrroline-5-carboxylate reductase [Acidimicrobiales bacterium]